MGVRIERETKRKLATLARTERRSLSAQALLFIEQGVKHLEAVKSLDSKAISIASGVKHLAKKGAAR